MFQFGDIVHVDHFPYSDKVDGKKRYAVVVSNSELPGEDYILAQITTKAKADKFSILLDDDMVLKPLKGSSAIRYHKLWTGNKKMLSNYSYAKLSTKGQVALRDALKIVIG